MTIASVTSARDLLSREPTRFLLVGAWNTCFGYGLFVIFTWLLTNRVPDAYIPAAVLSHVLSVSVAFCGYRWFVFRASGRWLRQYLRCHLVYGISFIVSFSLLILLVGVGKQLLGDQAFIPYLAGGVITIAMAIVSFFAHKYFSFVPDKPAALPPAAPVVPPADFATAKLGPAPRDSSACPPRK